MERCSAKSRKDFELKRSKLIPWAFELIIHENYEEIDRVIVTSEKDAILYLVKNHDFKVMF